jgi:hypothetical protein
MTNIGGFQQFIINKGWKRYKEKSQIHDKTFDYKDNTVSGYGPTHYMFENEEYPEIKFWWGLHEVKKPPVFCLSRIFIKSLHNKNLFEDKTIPEKDKQYKSEQDLWFEILKTVEFETIYEALLNKGTLTI